MNGNGEICSSRRRLAHHLEDERHLRTTRPSGQLTAAIDPLNCLSEQQFNNKKNQNVREAAFFAANTASPPRLRLLQQKLLLLREKVRQLSVVAAAEEAQRDSGGKSRESTLHHSSGCGWTSLTPWPALAEQQRGGRKTAEDTEKKIVGVDWKTGQQSQMSGGRSDRHEHSGNLGRALVSSDTVRGFQCGVGACAAESQCSLEEVATASESFERAAATTTATTGNVRELPFCGMGKSSRRDRQETDMEGENEERPGKTNEKEEGSCGALSETTAEETDTSTACALEKEVCVGSSLDAALAKMQTLHTLSCLDSKQGQRSAGGRTEFSSWKRGAASETASSAKRDKLQLFGSWGDDGRDAGEAGGDETRGRSLMRSCRKGREKKDGEGDEYYEGGGEERQSSVEESEEGDKGKFFSPSLARTRVRAVDILSNGSNSPLRSSSSKDGPSRRRRANPSHGNQFVEEGKHLQSQPLLQYRQLLQVAGAGAAEDETSAELFRSVLHRQQRSADKEGGDIVNGDAPSGILVELIATLTDLILRIVERQEEKSRGCLADTAESSTLHAAAGRKRSSSRDSVILKTKMRSRRATFPIRQETAEPVPAVGTLLRRRLAGATFFQNHPSSATLVVMDPWKKIPYTDRRKLLSEDLFHSSPSFPIPSSEQEQPAEFPSAPPPLGASTRAGASSFPLPCMHAVVDPDETGDPSIPLDCYSKSPKAAYIATASSDPSASSRSSWRSSTYSAESRKSAPARTTSTRSSGGGGGGAGAPDLPQSVLPASRAPYLVAAPSSSKRCDPATDALLRAAAALSPETATTGVGLELLNKISTTQELLPAFCVIKKEAASGAEKHSSSRSSSRRDVAATKRSTERRGESTTQTPLLLRRSPLSSGQGGMCFSAQKLRQKGAGSPALSARLLKTAPAVVERAPSASVPKPITAQKKRCMQNAVPEENPNSQQRMQQLSKGSAVAVSASRDAAISPLFSDTPNDANRLLQHQQAGLHRKNLLHFMGVPLLALEVDDKCMRSTAAAALESFDSAEVAREEVLSRLELLRAALQQQRDVSAATSAFLSFQHVNRGAAALLQQALSSVKESFQRAAVSAADASSAVPADAASMATAHADMHAQQAAAVSSSLGASAARPLLHGRPSKAAVKTAFTTAASVPSTVDLQLLQALQAALFSEQAATRQPPEQPAEPGRLCRTDSTDALQPLTVTKNLAVAARTAAAKTASALTSLSHSAAAAGFEQATTTPLQVAAASFLEEKQPLSPVNFPSHSHLASFKKKRVIMEGLPVTSAKTATTAKSERTATGGAATGQAEAAETAAAERESEGAMKRVTAKSVDRLLQQPQLEEQAASAAERRRSCRESRSSSSSFRVLNEEVSGSRRGGRRTKKSEKQESLDRKALKGMMLRQLQAEPQQLQSKSGGLDQRASQSSQCHHRLSSKQNSGSRSDSKGLAGQEVMSAVGESMLKTPADSRSSKGEERSRSSSGQGEKRRSRKKSTTSSRSSRRSSFSGEEAALVERDPQQQDISSIRAKRAQRNLFKQEQQRGAPCHSFLTTSAAPAARTALPFFSGGTSAAASLPAEKEKKLVVFVGRLRNIFVYGENSVPKKVFCVAHYHGEDVSFLIWRKRQRSKTKEVVKDEEFIYGCNFNEELSLPYDEAREGVRVTVFQLQGKDEFLDSLPALENFQYELLGVTPLLLCQRYAKGDSIKLQQGLEQEEQVKEKSFWALVNTQDPGASTGELEVGITLKVLTAEEGGANLP